MHWLNNQSFLYIILKSIPQKRDAFYFCDFIKLRMQRNDKNHGWGKKLSAGCGNIY
jgi:hypothetical protein